jgi:hypothetical protein
VNSLLRISLVLTVVMTLVAESPPPLFEVVQPAGLKFTLENSPTPQKHLIETMPGGVALFDYNNDGLLDIFFVNGGRITSPLPAQDDFDRHDPRYWNRLFRQNKDGSFTDVTEQAGLANAGDGNYGMGVSTLRAMERTFFITTTATGLSRMPQRRPEWRGADGQSRPDFSTTTTTEN